MKRLLFILVILAILAVAPAAATINISVKERSQSHITWEWDPGLTITNASIDGYWIRLFDPLSTEFTLSDLPSNETHTFNLYTATDTGTNTTKTLRDTSSYGTFMDVVNDWIYLIIIILLIWAGRALSKWFYWIASFVSLYALATFISKSESIITDVWHLPFLIYGALFIIPLLMFFFTPRRMR